MDAKRTIDVQDFIDHHPFSAYQKAILTLCFLIVAVDGFDTAAIGFIAPALKAEWGLTPQALGPLFGAGLGGLMLGAFIFGPLADRYGRKTILLFSVAFFGTASLVSMYSANLEQLVVLRFLTGLGLGGAMPNSITLTSEYCPAARRSSLVTLMFCGFTVGSAIGGLTAAQLVPAIGWRGILLLGGVLPLALVPVLWFVLPESVRFQVLNGHAGERIARTLRRIAPGTDLQEARFVLKDHKAKGFPARHLFDEGLGRGTVLLWATFFMTLLIIYLLSSWLPTVISSTGMSLQMASVVTAMFQIGGTVGAILIGRFMDRNPPGTVLAIAYALGAGCVALIGVSHANPWLLGLAVFCAGVTISGSQVGANALAAAYYPTHVRATGVSWASAVGRIGSVLGSMSGGVMLAAGLPLSLMFAIVAVPALLAALTIFVMGRLEAQREAAGANA